MGKERILFSKEIKVERIDKIIASQTNYSRKDVKKLISQKKVRVNDEIVKRPEQKFDEQQDVSPCHSCVGSVDADRVVRTARSRHL